MLTHYVITGQKLADVEKCYKVLRLYHREIALIQVNNVHAEDFKQIKELAERYFQIVKEAAQGCSILDVNLSYFKDKSFCLNFGGSLQKPRRNYQQEG